jgi:hypothetical protein
MKAYWGVVMNSALVERKWSASRPCRLTPPPPGTHSTGGWVGPRADLTI